MRTTKFLISFFIIFIFTTTLSAQNFNDALRLSTSGLGVGARALGMGGAFTGISDDYSATYWNPAGLFQIKRMELNAGLNYNNLKNDASFFNNTTSFENSGTSLSNLGFVFPFPTIRGSMVFGLGYSRVNNFNEALAFEGFNSGTTSYIQYLFEKDKLYGDSLLFDLYLTDAFNDSIPFLGKLTQSGNTLASGVETNWTLSGAMEVAKDFSVGMSLTILGGNLERNREYLESDEYGIYSARIDTFDEKTANFKYFKLDQTTSWELSGVGLKVGFMYRYKDILRFGGLIKFPYYFTIKELYTEKFSSEFGTEKKISPFLKRLGPYQFEQEYEIITPYQFSAGISVTRSLFTVSGDINLTDYTQMEFKIRDDPAKTVQNNKDIKTLFKSVMDYSVGAEVKVLDTGLKLRGGYMVRNSPFKNDPSDFNRKYITLGAGFHADESFALDIAYIMGKWKTFGDNYGSDVSRTYQNIKTTDIIFTTTFRF